ncbi:MAG: hypothetical protein JNN03_24025 [Rubrivivax sp.]|nr:hypothetical protein [Rubrivivax sp.]
MPHRFGFHAVMFALWIATAPVGASAANDPIKVLVADLDNQIGQAPAGSRTAAKLALIKKRAQALEPDCLMKADGQAVPRGDATPSCSQAVEQLRKLFKAVSEQQDSPDDEGSVMKAAAEAQNEVDKRRAKAKDAFDRGDAGTAAAVSLRDFYLLGSGPDNASVVARARKWANAAETKPRELRRAVTAAQAEADRLVALAVERRKCSPPFEPCVEKLLAGGLVAKAALELQLKIADEADEALSLAKRGLESLLANPASNLARLDSDVAFRALLESNPDVKSFFGGGAAGFSAGVAGSNVSFRYVIDQSGSWIGRRNRLTLIFSAPTNNNGVTNFASTVDGLQNLNTVKLGWQLTNAPFEFPGTGTLNDFAVGLSAGQKSINYLLVDGTTPTKAASNKKSVVTLELGVSWAFLANPKSKWKTLTVLGHSTQRGYKSADAETRCPVDPATTTAGLATCYTGSWGEPTRSTDRLISLEVRQHMPAFDLGLKIKQNLKNDKVDAEVPIYLIRNIPDQAEKTPFTAGISLGRSTGDKGLRWGLFVTAPLSFGKPER